MCFTYNGKHEHSSLAKALSIVMILLAGGADFDFGIVDTVKLKDVNIAILE